jgi:hypothetical protein
MGHPGGTGEFAILRLRQSSYFPSFLEHRRLAKRALGVGGGDQLPAGRLDPAGVEAPRLAQRSRAVQVAGQRGCRGAGRTRRRVPGAGGWTSPTLLARPHAGHRPKARLPPKEERDQGPVHVGLARPAPHPHRGDHVRPELTSPAPRARHPRRHLHRPRRHLPPARRDHQGPARPSRPAPVRPAAPDLPTDRRQPLTNANARLEIHAVHPGHGAFPHVSTQIRRLIALHQLRNPGERANAQLKTWRIFRKPRCFPWRAGQFAKAIHVLQIGEAQG